MDDKPLDLSKKSRSSAAESELPSSEKQQKEEQVTPSNINISSRATERNGDGESSNAGTKRKPKVLDDPDYSGRATENCLLSRPSTSTDTSCSYVPTAINVRSKQFSFVCGRCSRSFQDRPAFQRHVRGHAAERRFQCLECGERFRYSGDLTVHKRYHTGEKPFQCQQCDKRFVKSGNLKSHKRTHTGEKPFQCEACGERFAASFTLKMHKRTHTEEKPYSCPICGKAFSGQSNMKRHKKTHKLKSEIL